MGSNFQCYNLCPMNRLGEVFFRKTDCTPLQIGIQIVTFNYFAGTTEQLYTEESPFARA